MRMEIQVTKAMREPIGTLVWWIWRQAVDEVDPQRIAGVEHQRRSWNGPGIGRRVENLSLTSELIHHLIVGNRGAQYSFQTAIGRPANLRLREFRWLRRNGRVQAIGTHSRRGNQRNRSQ